MKNMTQHELRYGMWWKSGNTPEQAERYLHDFMWLLRLDKADWKFVLEKTVQQDSQYYCYALYENIYFNQPVWEVIL